MPMPPTVMCWARRSLAALLLLAVVAPLAGCGKKGPLDPPPGSEDVVFPRPYPTQ